MAGKFENNPQDSSNTGSHPDMFPPSVKPDAGKPLIAPFQPPMVTGDETNPFDATDWKTQAREYWSQHWQLISGIALIVVLLIAAIVLLLWSPEKELKREATQSELRTTTTLMSVAENSCLLDENRHRCSILMRPSGSPIM